MKNFVKILIFLIILGGFFYIFLYKNFNINKQLIVKTTNIDKDKKINLIKSQVIYINSIKDFQNIDLDTKNFFIDIPDGGIEVKAFIKDKKIYKIKESVGLSYGIIDTEYYFLQEKLIYVSETENYFPDNNDDGILEYDTLDFGFTTDYFFDNELLLYTTTTGQKKFLTEDNLQIKSEKDIENSAKEYLIYFYKNL